MSSGAMTFGITASVSRNAIMQNDFNTASAASASIPQLVRSGRAPHAASTPQRKPATEMDTAGIAMTELRISAITTTSNAVWPHHAEEQSAKTRTRAHDRDLDRAGANASARTLDRLWWGLIPYWVKDANGGRKPINAKSETVVSLASFREAYKRRRCLLPIDNFFEWRAIKGAKAKQPYATAMKSGEPFALAAIWENSQRPGADWVRTFAVITCPANDLMVHLHDRMPVIVASDNYNRWLANIEPDPRDLLVPYPSGPMTMWPISTRVNKPDNDAAAILDPVEAARDQSLL